MAVGSPQQLTANATYSSRRVHCGSLLRQTIFSSSVEPVDDEECELVSGKELTLESDADTFQCHLLEAVKNSNGAGILLLSDVQGYRNVDTRDFAYRLACSGFSVLLPDLFRGEPWIPTKPKSEYDTWRSQHAPERVAADISACTAFLRSHLAEDHEEQKERKLAVVGFCFGGGRLIETLASDADGAYSAGAFFYGTRFDSSLASRIKVPLLLIAGDSDSSCTVETVRAVEMKAAHTKVLVFPGRGHGFVHLPKDMEEDEDSEKAFAVTRQWLQTHLL